MPQLHQITLCHPDGTEQIRQIAIPLQPIKGQHPLRYQQVYWTRRSSKLPKAFMDWIEALNASALERKCDLVTAFDEAVQAGETLSFDVDK